MTIKTNLTPPALSSDPPERKMRYDVASLLIQRRLVEHPDLDYDWLEDVLDVIEEAAAPVLATAKQVACDERHEIEVRLAAEHARIVGDAANAGLRALKREMEDGFRKILEGDPK